ncbi:hypothetical protein EMIT0P260_140070 [Pseudomonas sp. IT-P260]
MILFELPDDHAFVAEGGVGLSVWEYSVDVIRILSVYCVDQISVELIDYAVGDCVCRAKNDPVCTEACVQIARFFWHRAFSVHDLSLNITLGTDGTCLAGFNRSVSDADFRHEAIAHTPVNSDSMRGPLDRSETVNKPKPQPADS